MLDIDELKRLSELTDEELQAITGGTDYTVYGETFQDTTKISDLLAKYTWLGDVYPDLKTAAAFGLTVGAAQAYLKKTDAEMVAWFAEIEATYNSDGTLK